MPATNKRILTLLELGAPTLASLVEDRVAALIVKGFSPPETCRAVAKWAEDSGNVVPYHHELKDDATTQLRYYGVDRIGNPFNLTLAGGERERAAYYAEALPGTRQVRTVVSPLLAPIDKLRLELDEIWPAGANVAAFEGKKMFVGIVRFMRASASAASEENPHVDVLPPDVCRLNNQFAANVFVRVPDEGGQLQIWDVPRLDVAAGQTSIDALTTSKRPIEISPQVGDLVMFSARKPHAIKAFPSGTRISVQCFVGHQEHGPLVLWN